MTSDENKNHKNHYSSPISTQRALYTSMNPGHSPTTHNDSATRESISDYKASDNNFELATMDIINNYQSINQST